jgi:hypothetical protein
MHPIQTSARAAVSLLQTALSDVTSALPGFSPSARAVDIQRLLGLDKKLGWQLHKFLTAPNPLTELASIPGEPSMRRILAAASRRSVSREITDRAAEAFEQFETLVAEHAKDRDELIALTNGLAATGSADGGSDQHHELRLRKAAFKSVSPLWGIKVETSVRTVGFAPDEGDTEQTFVVNGEIGLQRLRHGVPLTIVANSRHNPTTGERSLSPWQSRQEAAGKANPAGVGMRLIEELCSQPLPGMVSRVSADGNIETDIQFPPSGRSGAVTLYGMHHVRATAAGEQTRYSQGFTVRVPCERLHLELLVPRGWSSPDSVRVRVYGRRDLVDRGFERRAVDLLPQRETATYLGVMEAAVLMPGVPQHQRAVQLALEQVGWPGASFDVYRCEVEYPLLHTMISLDVDAAKR